MDKTGLFAGNQQAASLLESDERERLAETTEATRALLLSEMERRRGAAEFARWIAPLVQSLNAEAERQSLENYRDSLCKFRITRRRDDD